MKSKLFTLFVICFNLQLTAQQENSIQNIDIKTIESWLSESKTPAIAIATIENGKIHETHVQGKISKNQRVTEPTLFDVASLTKTITTLVTLKLVESSSWNLDMPLYNYWIDPDIKNNTHLKKLTTRHVLSHQTGFKNWRWMNESKKLTFDFEPGTKFQYSGEGFEYLRKSIENKLNLSLEKLSDSLIFKPNEMTHSYLTWNKNIDERIFAGTHDKEGKAYKYEKAYEVNAADNLLTTIEDLSKLCVNILNQQSLEKETYNQMIAPHSVVREGIDFGLGWIVFTDLPNNEYALFNAGSDTGVNALMVLFPESKRGLIVMTNGDNGRGLAMRAIGEFLGETGKEILDRF
ncbi:serine hydrolase domain-containing protein [uncultured Croceitalea sp.]|uniref:serine hydrolase domain-containing protein n=1 Tax=uncultured Croceitalea sp. TaxID=1798908 RepID=UPI00374F1B57